jgi:hypothetical protein
LPKKRNGIGNNPDPPLPRFFVALALLVICVGIPTIGGAVFGMALSLLSGPGEEGRDEEKS